MRPETVGFQTTLDWKVRRRALGFGDPCSLQSMTLCLVRSEISISYDALDTALASQRWQQAEKETVTLFRQSANLGDRHPLNLSEIQELPCLMLGTIDQLWRTYSDNWFGFSVQREIWQKCGSPVSYSDNWDIFGNRVGWRQGGVWLPYTQLNFELTSQTPRGHLPDLCLWGRRRAILFERYQYCSV